MVYQRQVPVFLTMVRAGLALASGQLHRILRLLVIPFIRVERALAGRGVVPDELVFGVGLELGDQPGIEVGNHSGDSKDTTPQSPGIDPD